MAYFLENMTMTDMARALERTKTVILPVGIIEQHGSHLPLSTDIYNATEPPKRAGDRLNAFVAPVVPYCFSGGELLGTLNINPQIFGLYVMEIAAEFLRMGFKNIIVFVGHECARDRAALRSIIQMLLRRNAHMKDITISLIVCFELSPTWLDQIKRRDLHAGDVETSLMLYWKPELVRETVEMDEPEIAENLRTQDWFYGSEKLGELEFQVPRVMERSEVKVGVMGYPERATRELGEIISSEMVENLIVYVDKLNRVTAAL